MKKCPLFSIFCIIFTTLFLIAFVRFSLNAEPLTFSSLLLSLESAPLIDFSDVLNFFQIGGNWGLLDFFRDLLNSFGGLLGVLSFIVLNLFNLLLFVLYFYNIIFIQKNWFILDFCTAKIIGQYARCGKTNVGLFRKKCIQFNLLAS